MATKILIKDLQIERGINRGLLLFKKTLFSLNFVDYLDTHGEAGLQDFTLVNNQGEEVYSFFKNRRLTKEGDPDYLDLENAAAFDAYVLQRETLESELTVLSANRESLVNESVILKGSRQAAQDALFIAQGALENETITQEEYDLKVLEADNARIAVENNKEALDVNNEALKAKRKTLVELEKVEKIPKFKNKYIDATGYIDEAGEISAAGIAALSDMVKIDFSKLV